jgi:hypothetical protein
MTETNLAGVGAMEENKESRGSFWVMLGVVLIILLGAGWYLYDKQLDEANKAKARANEQPRRSRGIAS